MKEWKIEGYDGLERTFERKIPFGTLSHPEVVTMLQRLACRSLSDDEVVDASLRRNAKAYVNHLEVRRNHGGRPGLMTTGTGMHYIATLVEE